ncbi:thioredoxin family protein [Lactobacillus helveticus]|uniref:thioredoxin family protein n=3 Tax=Lactobacillus helveticus TaxID=1587 RepID=UPI00345F02F4
MKLIGAKLRKMSQMIKNNLDIMPENAVLYFDNDWCAQCYSETNVVKEFAQIVGDAVHFYEINVNEKTKLATKFAVWSAPSIVLIKNGHKVDQFNKFLDLNQFKTLFDYYFSALKSKGVKEHAR